MCGKSITMSLYRTWMIWISEKLSVTLFFCFIVRKNVTYYLNVERKSWIENSCILLKILFVEELSSIVRWNKTKRKNVLFFQEILSSNFSDNFKRIQLFFYEQTPSFVLPVKYIKARLFNILDNQIISMDIFCLFIYFSGHKSSKGPYFLLLISCTYLIRFYLRHSYQLPTNLLFTHSWQPFLFRHALSDSNNVPFTYS